MSHPDQFDEAATIKALPKDIDGWTFTYEYPGVWTWSHPNRPDGEVAATPFWGDDVSTPVDWQDQTQGDYQPLGGFDFPVTGDPQVDAAWYVKHLRPFLAQLDLRNVVLEVWSEWTEGKATRKVSDLGYASRTGAASDDDDRALSRDIAKLQVGQTAEYFQPFNGTEFFRRIA